MRVLGFMSGTSLDAVDMAIVETDGETIEALGPAGVLPNLAPPIGWALVAASVGYVIAAAVRRAPIRVRSLELPLLERGIEQVELIGLKPEAQPRR